MSERHFALAELQRIVANMIRFGIITDSDPATARVKVSVGGLSSDWMPWQARRAGSTKTWSEPSNGEQVLVLSPFGDLAQAVALPAFYQDSEPAPASSQAIDKVAFADGSSVTYDADNNTLTVDVGTGNVIVNSGAATVNTETAKINAQQTVKVTAGLSITFDTPQATFTGKVNIDGLLSFAGGITGSGGNGAQFNCSINSTGGISASTSLKVNNIEVLGHDHTDPQGGNVGPMQ